MNKNTPLRQEIISWFKTDREFESGKTLYLKYGNNLSFKNILNRGGENDNNYNQLCYELAKLVGITEPQYKAILSKPIVKTDVDKAFSGVESAGKELITSKTVVDYNKKTPEEIALVIELVNPTTLDFNKLRAVNKVLGLKGGRSTESNVEAFNEAKEAKLVKIVPEVVRNTIKLREEFPFLNDKDCPSELKILVADMLTAYDAYVKEHEQLIDETDPEVVAMLSKSVVENYLENRAIWAELNHYKEKKIILGEHPLFAWIDRENEIKALDKAELVKLRDQLKNNIPRTKRLIKDEPEHKETENREKRLEQFEKEFTLVNELLEMNG